MKDVIVFLIDDDEVNNYLSKAVLEEFLPGEAILEFTSPLQALKQVQGSSLSQAGKKFVFFVDINMPGMSGWELIRQLKQLSVFDFPGKDSIYVLSSSINPRDKEIADAEGAVCGFIEKPVTTKAMQQIFC